MKLERRHEQIVRGFANHKRIEILRLLKREPGLSVEAIRERVRGNYQTVSEHVRRLHRSGLIHKRQPGPAMEHELTERGDFVLAFLYELR